MDEVKKLRDSIDRWRVPFQERQNMHHVALFGNGKPGLDEEIRNINRLLGILMKFAWVAATVITTAVISGVIAAAVYLIKVMP